MHTALHMLQGTSSAAPVQGCHNRLPHACASSKWYVAVSRGKCVEELQFVCAGLTSFRFWLRRIPKVGPGQCSPSPLCFCRSAHDLFGCQLTFPKVRCAHVVTTRWFRCSINAQSDAALFRAHLWSWVHAAYPGNSSSCTCSSTRTYSSFFCSLHLSCMSSRDALVAGTLAAATAAFVPVCDPLKYY